jgi:hypothetical protein
VAYNDSDSEKWRGQLEDARKVKPPALEALRHKKQWRTKSKPFLLRCQDGNDYVVKTINLAARQIINDQLIARLGVLLKAPVGEPALVWISSDLIQADSHLGGVTEGFAHGTLWIPNCMDQYELIATSEPENRLRLVLLATLYGWAVASDHQFLFTHNPPRLIYSVDHGHFFPNPPDWQIKDLQNCSQADLDSFFKDCNFTPCELKQAYDHLKAISTDDIVKAVSIIPEEWGFTMEEQVAVVIFLNTRQKQLLAILQSI